MRRIDLLSFGIHFHNNKVKPVTLGGSKPMRRIDDVDTIDDFELELFMRRLREGCERIARREATADQILDEMFPEADPDDITELQESTIVCGTNRTAR
jgi:hypothetical protein